MARPTKEFNERRGEQMKFNATSEERARVEQAASSLGLSTAEYLRRRTLGYRMPQATTDKLAATALIRLGVNLNQIAHHLNAGRPASHGMVDQLHGLLARIHAELDGLYGPRDHEGGPVL